MSTFQAMRTGAATVGIPWISAGLLACASGPTGPGSGGGGGGGSGSSPRVYFDTDRDGRLEIYYTDLTGAAPVRVTTNQGADDFGVAYSAQSGKIVWSRGTENVSAELWIADPDGSNARALTSNGGENLMPALDGVGKIAWSRDGNLWIMDDTGANSVQVTSTSDLDFDPSWESASPARIAFSRHGAAGSDIYCVNADGTGLTPLLTGPSNEDHPVWRASQSLFFEDDRSGNDEIWAVLLSNLGAPVQVTNHAADDDDPVFVFVGGDAVVLESDRSGNDDIWYVPPGGAAGIVPLTTHPGADRRPAVSGSP